MEGLEPLKICRGVTVCFDPLKCHILLFKTVAGYLCKLRIMKDERLVSQMEGTTNLLRHQNSLMAWPDWPQPPPPLFHDTGTCSLTSILNCSDLVRQITEVARCTSPDPLWFCPPPSQTSFHRLRVVVYAPQAISASGWRNIKSPPPQKTPYGPPSPATTFIQFCLLFSFITEMWWSNNDFFS